MLMYNIIHNIVKRKINSVSKLKKIGIPIDPLDGIDIHEIIELQNVEKNDKEELVYQAIPILYQVTMCCFYNTQPRTFNFNSDVIVIIENIENKGIFFIPYSEKAISIIASDNYIQDSEIYIPRLIYGADSFSLNAHMIQWRISLFICKFL